MCEIRARVVRVCVVAVEAVVHLDLDRHEPAVTVTEPESDRTGVCFRHQGLGNCQDRRCQRQGAAQLRRSRHDVRVRGDDRRQEADGDHQRDARERQVSARQEAATERGTYTRTHAVISVTVAVFICVCMSYHVGVVFEPFTL